MGPGNVKSTFKNWFYTTHYSHSLSDVNSELRIFIRFLMEYQSRGWLTPCIPYLWFHIRWGRGTGIFQSTCKRNWVYTTSNRQSSPGENKEFLYNIVLIGISIKGLAYTLNPIFGASYSVRMRPRKDQSLIGVKLYNVLKIYDTRLFFTRHFIIWNSFLIFCPITFFAEIRVILSYFTLGCRGQVCFVEETWSR